MCTVAHVKYVGGDMCTHMSISRALIKKNAKRGDLRKSIPGLKPKQNSMELNLTLLHKKQNTTPVQPVHTINVFGPPDCTGTVPRALCRNLTGDTARNNSELPLHTGLPLQPPRPPVPSLRSCSVPLREFSLRHPDEV